MNSCDLSLRKLKNASSLKTLQIYPTETDKNAIPTKEAKQVHDVLQGKRSSFIPEDGGIPYGRHGDCNQMRCP